MIQEIIVKWGPTITAVLAMVGAVATAISKVKSIAKNSDAKLRELKAKVNEQFATNVSILKEDVEIKEKVNELVKVISEKVNTLEEKEAEVTKTSDKVAEQEQALKETVQELKTLKKQLTQILRNK